MTGQRSPYQPSLGLHRGAYGAEKQSQLRHHSEPLRCLSERTPSPAPSQTRAL